MGSLQPRSTRPDVRAGSGHTVGVRRALMVEDDASVADAVRDSFSRYGISLRHASCIADGLQFLTDEEFDVIILDVSLPDGDGRTLLDACRSSGCDTPIILVTARDGVSDRIEGLRRGADDYLCKPFAVGELLARVEAVTRRLRSPQRHRLVYADVELDLVKRRVRRLDREADLSTRELDLLAYFLCHPEEILSQERIIKDVWGLDAPQDTGVLRVYTNYLRNKLGHPRIIHTVRNAGYILSVQDPEDVAPES